MELTKALVDNILATEYEDLPQEVIEKTKRHIMDTLGVMLPATTFETGCIAIEEIAREGGGKEESTLIGFGGKVPCWMAAFVNGSLCHPMDYDDTVDEFVNHPSSHTLPAALAVAEKVGNVTGKEFITAIALGIDLNVRLSASPRGKLVEDYPWFPTTIFGVFSATAAAGKLLGLTDVQMANALGIAVDRASGIRQSITSSDSEMRAIRDGFGNKEGVLAALMAKKGIIACRDSIEIFYKSFYRDLYDNSPLISNLGVEFWGLKVGLKCWPCCRMTHSYVKPALDIVNEHDISPDGIEEVLLTVGSYGRDRLLNHLEEKQKPKLSIAAKQSLPFIMGVVLAKRRAIIEDFLPQNLADPKVLEIARKVKQGRFDVELCSSPISGGEVEVRMHDGRSFMKAEDRPYGHPKNPMTDRELVAKFRDCARYATRPLSEEKVDRLVQIMFELEKVKDIRDITKILA